MKSTKQEIIFHEKEESNVNQDSDKRSSSDSPSEEAQFLLNQSFLGGSSPLVEMSPSEDEKPEFLGGSSPLVEISPSEEEEQEYFQPRQISRSESSSEEEEQEYFQPWQMPRLESSSEEEELNSSQNSDILEGYSINSEKILFEIHQSLNDGSNENEVNYIFNIDHQCRTDTLLRNSQGAHNIAYSLFRWMLFYGIIRTQNVKLTDESSASACIKLKDESGSSRKFQTKANLSEIIAKFKLYNDSLFSDWPDDIKTGLEDFSENMQQKFRDERSRKKKQHSNILDAITEDIEFSTEDALVIEQAFMTERKVKKNERTLSYLNIIRKMYLHLEQSFQKNSLTTYYSHGRGNFTENESAAVRAANNLLACLNDYCELLEDRISEENFKGKSQAIYAKYFFEGKYNPYGLSILVGEQKSPTRKSFKAGFSKKSELDDILKKNINYENLSKTIAPLFDYRYSLIFNWKSDEPRKMQEALNKHFPKNFFDIKYQQKDESYCAKITQKSILNLAVLLKAYFFIVESAFPAVFKIFPEIKLHFIKFHVLETLEWNAHPFIENHCKNFSKQKFATFLLEAINDLPNDGIMGLPNDHERVSENIICTWEDAMNKQKMENIFTNTVNSSSQPNSDDSATEELDPAAGSKRILNTAELSDSASSSKKQRKNPEQSSSTSKPAKQESLFDFFKNTSDNPKSQDSTSYSQNQDKTRGELRKSGPNLK